MGIIALFFCLFMLVCAGGVLNQTGTIIHNCADAHHGKLKDCFFTKNSTRPHDPSVPGSMVVTVEPYMQAEFAGVFLYSIFQSLSLCLYFFRAHASSEERLLDRVERDPTLTSPRLSGASCQTSCLCAKRRC